MKYKDVDIDLSDYKVNCIFVINMPTFYMHNAVHRIHTYRRLAEVLTGEYEDKVFDLLVEIDETVTMYR